MMPRPLVYLALIFLLLGTVLLIVATVLPQWMRYSSTGRDIDYGLWRVCVVHGQCFDHSRPDELERSVRVFMVTACALAGVATILGLVYVIKTFNANTSTKTSRIAAILITGIGFAAMGSSLLAAILYASHWLNFEEDVLFIEEDPPLTWLGASFHVNYLACAPLVLGALMLFAHSKAWRQPGAALTSGESSGTVVQSTHPPVSYPAYGQPAYIQLPYGQPPYGQPPYGQPPYGQPPYGQPPYTAGGQHHNGQPAYTQI